MIINLCCQWTANCRAETQHCSAVSTPRPSDAGIIIIIFIIIIIIMQVRFSSSDVIKETEALSLRTQSANTKKLTERLHDINYWKAELQRQITDMISETDLLCQQKLRLENALRATEIPLHIATDNLHCRQRRQGIDLVQDNVEIYLLKVRLS